MPEKKYCKSCGDEIQGRVDKQYCSDQCRAIYFHRTHHKLNAFIRRVNLMIRRNRTILAHIPPEQRKRIHKISLLDKGLNFDYVSSVYQSIHGGTYYFCYDQGYVALEGDYYAIIKREDYLNGAAEIRPDHSARSVLRGGQEK